MSYRWFKKRRFGLIYLVFFSLIISDFCCITIIADNEWDKSSMEVIGFCRDETVFFTISNTGDPGFGDMENESQYRLYRNDILETSGSFQLNGGESIIVSCNADCDSIRLEVDQHPYHPGNGICKLTIEDCGCDDSDDLINDDNSSENPDDNTSNIPDDNSSENPDDNTSNIPDDNSSENPDDNTTENPDDNTSNIPDDNSSENPDDNSNTGNNQDSYASKKTDYSNITGGKTPNLPPIANVNLDNNFVTYINENILFDGSNSSDPDGYITDWIWDFGQGVYIKGEKIYHMFDKRGTYNVTLMVVDNEGATNSTTFNLIVDGELYSEINTIQITGNDIHKVNYGYIILLITAIMIFIILSTRTTLDDRKKIV